MQSTDIAGADLLDILFDGRNKAYGAYQLRRTYHQRITKALAGTVTIVIVFCVMNLLAQNQPNAVAPIFVKDLHLADHPEPPKDPEPPVVPPQPTQPVKSIQYVTPLIVPDETVTELVPEMEEIADAVISTITVKSDRLDEGFITPPIETTTTTTVAPATKNNDYEDRFTKIEKEAMFPGGVAAWRRYLERNLEASIAADEGAAQGLYTVKLQFTVDVNGTISNVQVLEKPAACPGCAAEAVRVIKKGPKWEPAIQNGRAVNYQAVQTVTFEVRE